jgi:hypothetical protein
LAVLPPESYVAENAARSVKPVHCHGRGTAVNSSPARYYVKSQMAASRGLPSGWLLPAQADHPSFPLDIDRPASLSILGPRHP